MGCKMMSSMHLYYAVKDWGRVHMSHRYQAALEYNDIAQEWNSRKRAYQRARKSRQKMYSDEGERRRTAPIRCRTRQMTPPKTRSLEPPTSWKP